MDKKYVDALGDLNLIITDGSFLRKGGMVRKDKETQALYGHNGIPNLIDLFKAHTATILFVHFGYKDITGAKQKLEELEKEKNIKIIFGYDGAILNL